nr:C45 family peptidase [Klebsiella quasipneumoniae]
MKTIAIRGSAFAVGQQLGAFGREAWQTKIRQTALWQTVAALKTTEQTQRMRAAVQAQFPLIWQELEGMAEGLQAPVDEVFAWNCRGDLVRSTSDGCTTLAGRSAEGELIIAHNEDGFPQLREDCAIVSITPDVGLAFTSFAYPGSLCGHTFAVNEKGIVNTVNNIRAVHRPDGMPRQILARASLNATTLEEAVTLLSATPRAGAFHHTLGQMGDSRLFSVEATGSGSSVLALSATSGHANHLIHPQLAAIEQIVTGSSVLALSATSGHANHLIHPQLAAIEQIVTGSSGSRQRRLDAWLATAIFTLSATRVVWQVFTLDRENAVLQGSV